MELSNVTAINSRASSGMLGIMTGPHKPLVAGPNPAAAT